MENRFADNQVRLAVFNWLRQQKDREDVMRETDGPMLRHGLQGLHGSSLVLPSRHAEWPDPDRLAERFDRFCLNP